MKQNKSAPPSGGNYMSGLSDEDLVRFIRHAIDTDANLDALMEIQRRLQTEQAKKEVIDALKDYVDFVQQEMQATGVPMFKTTTSQEPRQPTDKAKWLTLALAFLIQFALTITWISGIKATADSAKETTARTEGRMDEVSRVAAVAAERSSVNTVQINAIEQRLTRIEQKLDRLLEPK